MKSISSKIRLAFVSILAITVIALSVITFLSVTNQLDKANEELEHSFMLLEELIHLKTDEAMGIGDVYAHDPRIIDALKSNDRNEVS